jgi:hypothetical protein
MAVQDAEGNMQLMPRFDHTLRMSEFGTLIEPTDANVASTYTKFYRPVLYEYRIIDNSGNEVAGTGIISDNYVTFKHMAAFNAVKSPAYIYLVGNPTGWQTPNAGNADLYKDWRLYEKADEIGSDIYYGTFDIPAIDPLQFRFYRELINWDLTSMGPQEADAGVDCAFDNNKYEGSIMWDKEKFYKGSWNFGAFEGGSITMKVDLKKKSVEFTIN